MGALHRHPRAERDHQLCVILRASEAVYAGNRRDERVAGGLSSPEEALKLANDSIAYSIRKTTSDVASLHERYRQDCELQTKIDQYKKAGKKIPASWIKNPYYLRYYREKNMLETQK